MELLQPDDARDAAVIDILEKLTPEWQSFACDPMPDAMLNAIQRLIYSGFAKTRLEYRVTNFDTGDWIHLRFVLSGQFLGDPVLRMTAAQCPPNWFDWDRMKPASNVKVSQDQSDWMLAITDDGDRLRHLPDDRELLLEMVQCFNAKAVIRKDGGDQGRQGTSGADGYTEDDRKRDDAVADRVLVQDRTPVTARQLETYTDSEISVKTFKTRLAALGVPLISAGGNGRTKNEWEYCAARDALNACTSGELESWTFPETHVELLR
ncbi:MAG: hypothetical protein ABGZ17_05685 [Planctomycetaceae bacterium]